MPIFNVMPKMDNKVFWIFEHGHSQPVWQQQRQIFNDVF